MSQSIVKVIVVEMLVFYKDYIFLIEEDLEEEGLDWEELEEKAAKEDKKHESKYGKDERETRGKKRPKRD